MTQLGEGAVAVSFLERVPRLGQVERDRLPAVVGGRELAARGERARRFLLASRARERQAELIARFSAVGLEACGLFELPVTADLHRAG